MKQIILLFNFLLVGCAIAQDMTLDVFPLFPGVDTEPTISEPPKPGAADTLFRDYIPYDYGKDIEVKVNLIFVQKENGTGNFDENNEEHTRLWDSIEASINRRYSRLGTSVRDSCYAWKDPFIDESRIRFVFNRFYIRNDQIWDWSNYGSSPMSQSSALNDFRDELISDSVVPKGICVFFTENSEAYDRYLQAIVNGTEVEELHAQFAYAFFPTNTSLPKVHIPDAFTKFLWMKHIIPEIWESPVTWETDVWYWEVNTMDVALSHELGHALSLDHSCNHYGLNSCVDALMAPRGVSPYTHKYVPPTEIGKMHKALSTTALRDAVDKEQQVVGQMKVFDSHRYLSLFRSFSHILVKDKGKIVALGGMHMPAESRIEVEGQLYVKGNSLSCAISGGAWAGIRVKAGGLLWLESTNVYDYNIIMDSGSTLVLKGSLNFENGHKIVLNKGVHVCVDRSFEMTAIHKPFVCEGGLLRGLASGTILDNLFSYNPDDVSWSEFLSQSEEILDTLYIQNLQILSNETFVAKRIMVGENVYDMGDRGEVVLKNGSQVFFITHENIQFCTGFQCEPGSYFKVLNW